MAAIVDDEKWRKFFTTYKSLTEIWEVKSDAYKNRDKRNIGWRKLLDVYRTIDKNATMDNLKHRVNNIRTCYRRELRKIQLSERYGPDSVHVPTLWYFGHLDFIRDQETNVKHRWRDTSFILDDIEDIPLSEPELEEPKPLPKRLKIKKRKMTHHRDDDDDDEQQPEKRVAQDPSKDEASIYADGWACSYRKLTIEQQLYAKKAIEEVLILGQLNALNLETVDATSSMKVISKPEFEEIYDPNDQLYNDEEMND